MLLYYFYKTNSVLVYLTLNLSFLTCASSSYSWWHDNRKQPNKKAPSFFEHKSINNFQRQNMEQVSKNHTYCTIWSTEGFKENSDQRGKLFICLILSLLTSTFLFCWPKLKMQMSPLHPPTLKGESQSIPHNLSFPFKTGSVLHIHYHIKNTLPEACISCCAIMSSRPQLSAWGFRTQIFNSKL